MRNRNWRVAVGAGCLTLLLGQEALAIIGRPLTPVSFAGVARRTTRRAVYGAGAGLAVGSVAAGTVAAAATIATLPPSCTTVVNGGVSYHQCGSSWYRPYYQGPNLVYSSVPPPY